MLSFRQCERHTFSMRAGRETKYNIRVQYFSDNHRYRVAQTGTITQRFSLADKTSMSEVCLKLQSIYDRIYKIVHCLKLQSTYNRIYKIYEVEIHL